MKYTNSIYTPNMSGKQGNTVFSKNQYGPYSCERSIPVDPHTEAQQKVRQGTSGIARSWATLTDLQRDNWRSKANEFPFQKKGIQYFLTGFMFYMKLNRNLYEIGEPPVYDFTSYSNIDPQSLKSFSVELINTPSGPDLLVHFNPAIKNNSKVIIYATKPVKSSEQYGTHTPFKIAVLDNTFISGSSIKDYYLKKYLIFPNIYQKAYFNIKSTNIKSGFSSNVLSSSILGI